MPDETYQPNPANVIADALRGLRITNTDYPAAGTGFEWDGVPHIIMPNNCSLENLEKSMPHPRRIRAFPALVDLNSFTAYVEKFKTPETTIFGQRHNDGLNVTAIFDYPAPGAPAWGSHRARLDTAYSEEWKRWQGHEDEEMSQTEFAEFVENEKKLFVKPTGADMLTLATEIDLRRTVTWKGTTRLANGDVACEFISETKTGGKGDIELPPMFSVALQPFLNGERYEVQARLRPDITEGKLTLHYELQKTAEIIDHAIEEMMEAIVEKTGITPLIGTAPQSV